MNSETVVRDTDVFMVSKEGNAELTGGWTKLPALEYQNCTGEVTLRAAAAKSEPAK